MKFPHPVNAITVALFALAACIFLSSCSFIESDAGKSHYQYQVTTADGTKHEIDIRNAKDIGLISAKVTRLDDGSIEVELIEEGVNASSAMGIMAEQNSIMMGKMLDMIPVTTQ